MVNMLGQRFYDETGQAFTSNDYNSINPYTQGSYLNAKNITYKPNNWLNAAMAGIGDGHNGGGPIWAIFDADAVARENWVPTPPNVDIAGGFFFSADTLADLARKIVMKYQRVPMPPDNLEQTVARYNSFVDSGDGRGFRQTQAAVQDRHAAVLCRLGDAGDSRHPRGLAHQRELPGDGYERSGHPRALLRRRIGGRLQPARFGPCHLPGLYRGPSRGFGIADRFIIG